MVFAIIGTDQDRRNMRFRRTMAMVIAGATAAAGIATSAGLPAVAARAATTSVQLPIPTYSHMLLDPAHQHIFFSGGSGSDSILVTDYSGNTVATIPNEPGATGLALSSDGSTVYAALTSGDAISAISASTLAETARYATGTGTDPTYVAYTSGKIWFGYGSYGGPEIGVGSIDPSSSPASVTLNAVPSFTLSGGSYAPIVTASPNGELVAYEPYETPAEIASFDVSSGTATVLAPAQFTSTAGFPGPFTPDGKDVLTSSGQVLRVSDLSADGDYPIPFAGNSVSMASDGTVAVGMTGDNSSGVYLFAPGESTPQTTYYPASNGEDLATDGVALTPDASKLFAVTDLAGTNALPTLNIVSDPAQVGSALTLDGPGMTVKYGQPINLTGTLTGTMYGSSVYTAGQSLTVTRFDPADPNGVALPDVTTAADGSFSFTDTPPKLNADKGTITYQVSYAGDVHLSASNASTSVTIQYNGS
jgi:hypothetical protein